MPANKNQHFVPKMYLKLFANPDGASIGVFNLAAGRYIGRASIRDQASKPWFYDRDGTAERAFGRIESRAAAIIGHILAHDRLPPRRRGAHHGLISFITLQMQRTQAAVAMFNEQADTYVKAHLRHAHAGQAELAYLDSVKIRSSDPMAELVQAAYLGRPLLFDLKYKLIVNNSGRAFFISDAPVVLHNDLYAGTGAPAEGWASVGLQIILPLGPWRALLFYDELAYDVGNSASRIVRLVNPDHAARINDLQWEAAHKNLYVSPTTEYEELVGAAAYWKTARRGGNALLTDKILQDDEHRKHIRLGIGRTPSTVSFDLPLVRKRLPKPGPWIDDNAPALRDPEWAELVSMLARQVRNDQLSYRDFQIMTMKAPPALGHRKKLARAALKGTR